MASPLAKIQIKVPKPAASCLVIQRFLPIEFQYHHGCFDAKRGLQ